MLTVVVAGGLGTRLFLQDTPKAMVSIGGKPLLQRTIDCFVRQGLRDFLFKVGYRADAIIRHFGDGSRFGCRIAYVREENRLGTAGGLRFIERETDSVIVVYGDLLVDADLRGLISRHRQTGARATLLVHDSTHPEDSDVVEADSDGRVTRLIHKPGSDAYGRSTNTGVFVLRPECFSHVPAAEPFDFALDLFPQMLRRGEHLAACATTEYVKDIGRRPRLAEAEADLASGRAYGSVDAVFLDRDGTINEEVNLLHRPEDFRLLPNAAVGIRMLNASRIRVIVATNQPVVARNLCTEQDVDRIHDRMRVELARYDAFVDAVYYCPHHPEKHHPDGNPAYRIDCDCRKPQIGLVLRARDRFDLDLHRCIFVGDTSTDMQTASAAGMWSVLVSTGYAGRDAKHAVRPHFVAADLLEAAELAAKISRGAPGRIAVAAERARERQPRVAVVVVGSSGDARRNLAAQLCGSWRGEGARAVALEAWPCDVGSDVDLVVLEGPAIEAAGLGMPAITVLAHVPDQTVCSDVWRNVDYIV